ncbi:MAG: ATP:cob(I)alamin adenosyltransferase [Actinobacteria bacterium HGW-Actinobacteria-10]|jgi:cob(I)alamin adenosyltransferase|nr:MAG: ATP:cob(I)alamin adenosyltransferase [Actinobacteria bacterium HGW-Actinobacteria-10]
MPGGIVSRPIYTRHGDSGETSLAGGTRIPKTSARIEAIGTLDEANSAIGLARAALAGTAADGPGPGLDGMLDFVQHRLFNAAGLLATARPATPLTTAGDAPAVDAAPAPTSRATVTPDDTATLESWIDALSAGTGELVRFVLPGGSESAARLHVARTVVRRAERRVLDLHANEPIDEVVLAFINRLSDLLFAAARYENRKRGDVTWDPEK